jgi:hypothetical protein
LFEKKSVVNRVKGLRDIEGDDCHSRWRLSLIKAIDCSIDQRKKTRGSRAKRPKTVLSARKRKTEEL